MVGDDHECVVIDAPHEAAPIQALIGGRRVSAILCTHGTTTTSRPPPNWLRATGAPVRLHPADEVLWRQS